MKSYRTSIEFSGDIILLNKELFAIKKIYNALKNEIL